MYFGEGLSVLQSSREEGNGFSQLIHAHFPHITSFDTLRVTSLAKTSSLHAHRIFAETLGYSFTLDAFNKLQAALTAHTSQEPPSADADDRRTLQHRSRTRMAHR